MRTLLACLFLPLGLGCGIDPAKIPDHALYADDGQMLEAPGAITFAVLGNSRDIVPGLDRTAGRFGHGAEVATQILTDIHAAAQTPAGPTFAVLMGDTVGAGSVSEWRAFDERHSILLEGATVAPLPGMRIPGVPVAGTREAAGDERFFGLEGAWPGVGATIGYNRVATWYAFDVKTQGKTWRFLVLDGGKARLGSRWQEEKAWIPKAVAGKYEGLIIFMHDPEVDLGGKQLVMNVDGGPHELLETVEDATDLSRIRMVFGAGSYTNQALLPDGPFGAMHINAGGGGGPAEDLKRWGAGEASGRKGDIHLETTYDLALLAAMDRWNRNASIPDVVIDEAKARGAFTGFIGTYAGQHFPTYGWWKVSVAGQYVEVDYRLRLPDGSFVDLYRANFSEKEGWKASRPSAP